MSMWLYQLNQKTWSPEVFRYEIWENQRWHWTFGQKRGDATPETGDTIIFFYSPSAGNDPGIYAWAVLEKCDAESSTLYFIPTAPTNYLKMDPWWDDEVKNITDEIRGPSKQATLFLVSEEIIPRIRAGIRRWMAFVHAV